MLEIIRAGVEKLATHYCKQLRPDIISGSSDYARVFEFIDTLRKEGFKGSEISSRIDQVKSKKGVAPIEVEQLFSTSERQQKRYNKNLIEPGQQYLHIELKILPDLPKAQYDPETGEYIFEEIDQAVRIKESYTLDNLLNFFYQKCNIRRCDTDRDRGALYYLLTNMASVDEILFTISIVAEKDYKVNDAIGLRSYLQEGIEARENALETVTNMAQERGGFEWFPVI